MASIITVYTFLQLILSLHNVHVLPYLLPLPDPSYYQMEGPAFKECNNFAFKDNRRQNKNFKARCNKRYISGKIPPNPMIFQNLNPYNLSMNFYNNCTPNHPFIKYKKKKMDPWQWFTSFSTLVIVYCLGFLVFWLGKENLVKIYKLKTLLQ